MHSIGDTQYLKLEAVLCDNFNILGVVTMLYYYVGTSIVNDWPFNVRKGHSFVPNF